MRRSVTMLAIAGVAVGGMSEILVGSISEAAECVGLSEFFIGAIVVAIVGNAAEHWVAVLVARKDKMDLAVNIAIGSSAQIALFVAPLLVLCSFFIGPHPMALVLQRLRAGGRAAGGADRQPRRPTRASRRGSRASSCWRSTPSLARRLRLRVAAVSRPASYSSGRPASVLAADLLVVLLEVVLGLVRRRR